MPLLTPFNTDHLPLQLGDRIKPVETKPDPPQGRFLKPNLWLDASGKMAYLPPLPTTPRKGPASEPAAAPTEDTQDLAPASTWMDGTYERPADVTHYWPGSDDWSAKRGSADGLLMWWHPVHTKRLWRPSAAGAEEFDDFVDIGYLKPLPRSAR